MTRIGLQKDVTAPLSPCLLLRANFQLFSANLLCLPTSSVVGPQNGGAVEEIRYRGDRADTPEAQPEGFEAQAMALTPEFEHDD
jgi:hypothetical protein